MNHPTADAPPAPEPDIQALVDTVDHDWPLIDQVWREITVPRPDVHLQRQAGKEPFAFLADAFATARARRFLEPFGIALIKAGLGDDRFNEVLSAVLGSPPVRMHAMQNSIFLPIPAGPDAARYLRSCEYVCRIDVNGAHAGTGVLVAPTLVATASHVIEELVRPSPSGGYEPSPDSLQHLVLTFGVTGPSDDGADDGRGRIATLATDWLAWYSERAARERPLLDVEDTEGIVDPGGPWDLALIRVAEVLGPGRAAPLRVEHLQAGAFQVKVLHHPSGHADGGQRLLMSIGTVSKQLGGAPPLRALHDANTDHGSSGAPVFDEDWNVVALHQAGVAGWHALLPGVGRPGNRAVPVRALVEAVRNAAAAPPTLLPAGGPTSSNPTRLVIGRATTLERIRAAQLATAGPAQRLIIVRGEPGLGLHFTAGLVQDAVRGAPDDDELVHIDLANVVGDDGAAFASRVGGVLARAHLQRFRGSRMTTGPRTDAQLVAPLLRELPSALVRPRPLWLILEGVEGVAVDVRQSVKEAIVRLMTDLERSPYLRLVLIGWSDPVPEPFADSIETLVPPTGRDVIGYLRSPDAPEDPELTALAEEMLQIYRNAGAAWYQAAHGVLDEIRPFLEEQLARQLANRAAVGDP